VYQPLTTGGGYRLPASYARTHKGPLARASGGWPEGLDRLPDPAGAGRVRPY